MEIKIKPSDRNRFPIGGLFIKSPEAKTWVKELQEIGLSLEEIKIYPIPADTANVVWGCLVILNKTISNTISVKHERAQYLSNNLYIGENCEIEPTLLPSELSDFFSNSLYAFHPEFGLAELNEELDFIKLLLMPEMRSWFVNKPAESVFIPETIKSLQIIPLDDKAALKKMEEEVFPKREKMPDDSLSPLEKSKLFFYRALFSSASKKNGSAENTSTKKIFLNA